MGAMTRLQIAELQDRDDGDDLWFAGVCADIVNGASVDEVYANLCATYDVSWGAVTAWINAPAAPERRKQWDAALESRRQLRIERAAANVAKISQVPHGNKVKPSDTLRAAELVLNSGASTVSVSGSGGPRSITVMFVDAVDGKPAERVVNG